MQTFTQLSGYHRLIKARHGYFVYNMNDFYMGQAIEKYGECSEHEVELLSQFVKPDTVVWDIGANMGVLTVPLANLVGRHGQVIAFEPQPEVLNVLAGNIALNCLSQARTMPFALGDQPGIISIPDINYGQPGNFGNTSFVIENHGSSKVESRCIDDLSYLPVPQVMKIDVEGMELQVLQGGAQLIKQARPIIYCENDRVDKSEALIKYLWSLGYDLYWHAVPLYNPDNFFKNTENIYKTIVSINMLCLPAELDMQVKLPKITRAVHLQDREKPVAEFLRPLLTEARNLLQTGQEESAANILKYILRQQPDNLEVLIDLGAASLALGNHADSVAYYKQILQIKPMQAVAHFNLATSLFNLQNFAEALDNFEQAFAINPTYFEALLNQGSTLIKLGRHHEALTICGQVVSLKPDYAEAWLTMANVLLTLSYYEEALASYDFAIALQPDTAMAYVYRAMALTGLKRYAEALASCHQALFYNPGCAEAFGAQAVIFSELQRFEDALLSNQRAIALKPDYLDAYSNSGAVLQELGHFQKAMASYEKALAIQPEFMDARWNKALLTLLSGDFTEGWQQYECGLQSKYRLTRQITEKPRWLGEQGLAGKTLLITVEQGLGDMIQFCRYVPLLEAMDVKVVLEVPLPLLSLCATLSNTLTLVLQGQTLPEYDYYCPLMSLPLAFETTLSNIPASVPYLAVDAFKQQLWQQQLAGDRLKVGLVWAGSAKYIRRNIAVSQLAVLFDLPIDFHVLQKEITAEDEHLLAAYTNVYNHSMALRDFSDTAALLSCMDLTISIDTSVAHLAGALAKPVWVLLMRMADFRWLLERTDSPWYPTATLFRQDESRDWSVVLNNVRLQLAAMIKCAE